MKNQMHENFVVKAKAEAFAEVNRPFQFNDVENFDLTVFAN